jgi:hypothetical protein
VSGFVLADQAKNIDWKACQVQCITEASKDVVGETLEKLNALFGIEMG